MALFQNMVWFLDVRTVLVCVFLLLVLRWVLGRPKNLPPGPWGFPIIGSIPALLWEVGRGLEPHELFRKYAAKYGPVFRLKVLNKTVVVLNDYASVKEAFQHPQLNDRPQMQVLIEALKSEGITAASGETWMKRRRFGLTVLRSFGVGKSSFEETITTEAEELLKALTNLNGEPFDPKPLLGNAVSNVICSVIFGKRYEYTDREFRRLLGLISRSTALLGAGGAILFFPFLRYLPFFSTKEYMANFDELLKFVTGVVNAHRAVFDADNLTDLTDAYLLEMQQNRSKNQTDGLTNGGSSRSVKDLNEIGSIIADLFLAGTETAASTLHWSLLYMAVYPDIQQRVQAEIDAVVGRNRLPRLSDKPELNLTQAVIWEIQRLAYVVPLGLAHAAASDTQFRGFLIPKGAVLVPNVWSVFQDPNVWLEPEKFEPERFLTGEGKAVKPDELIPFSLGKRSCIGDSLAKMELFIFFSYIMHQFTFKKPDNSPPLSLKGRGGLTYSPVTFDICAVTRD